jgi:hypothetical protein
MLLHAAVRVASGRTCVIHPVDGVRSDLCSFLSFEIFRLPHRDSMWLRTLTLPRLVCHRSIPESSFVAKHRSLRVLPTKESRLPPIFVTVQRGTMIHHISCTPCRSTPIIL